MSMFRKSFTDDVKAVTPIISTLLLITIMLTIISAILYWSIPTMNRISWDTEYRTTMAGFETLDAALEDTVQGNVAGSSRSVRISIPDGLLLSYPRSSRWYISYTYDNAYDFEISGLDDEYKAPEQVTTFQIFLRPDINFDLKVTWYGYWEDTEPYSDIIPNKLFGDDITPEHPLLPSRSVEFLSNDTVRCVHFDITDHSDGSPIGKAYLIPMDRLEVKIPSEFGTARIISENGALITVYPNHAVINPPLLTYDPKMDRLNFNLVTINVSGISSVGRGNWEITMRLQAFNFSRIDGINNLRLRAFGEFSEAWHRYLLSHYDGTENTENVPVGDDRMDGVHITRDDQISLNLMISTVLFDVEGV